MKWRLQEGDGEAIYEIGVEDNGVFVGLTREELDSSLNTLNVMASKLGAHTTLLRRHVVENENSGPGRQVAEVLVRRVPDDQQVFNHVVLGYVYMGPDRNHSEPNQSTPDRFLFTWDHSGISPEWIQMDPKLDLQKSTSRSSFDPFWTISKMVQCKGKACPV